MEQMFQCYNRKKHKSAAFRNDRFLCSRVNTYHASECLIPLTVEYNAPWRKNDDTTKCLGACCFIRHRSDCFCIHTNVGNVVYTYTTIRMEGKVSD